MPGKFYTEVTHYPAQGGRPSIWVVWPVPHSRELEVFNTPQEALQYVMRGYIW